MMCGLCFDPGLAPSAFVVVGANLAGEISDGNLVVIYNDAGERETNDDIDDVCNGCISCIAVDVLRDEHGLGYDSHSHSTDANQKNKTDNEHNALEETIANV